MQKALGRCPTKKAAARSGGGASKKRPLLTKRPPIGLLLARLSVGLLHEKHASLVGSLSFQLNLKASQLLLVNHHVRLAAVALQWAVEQQVADVAGEQARKAAAAGVGREGGSSGVGGQTQTAKSMAHCWPNAAPCCSAVLGLMPTLRRLMAQWRQQRQPIPPVSGSAHRSIWCA